MRGRAPSEGSANGTHRSSPSWSLSFNPAGGGGAQARESQNCRHSSRGHQVQADLLAMVARDDQSERTGSVGHPGDGLAIEVEDGSGRGE